MKRFVIKLMLYASVFIIVINLISFLGMGFLYRSSIFKPSFLVNNFNSKEKFDYFILGSSRGLTTLNTTLIDQKLDFYGINLSMDDTGLRTHKLMLEHFYHQGFKSNYCVLVLDAGHFKETKPQLGNNDYRFIPFIREKVVREYFGQYEHTPLRPLYNSLYLPFLAFSYYNIQLFPVSALAVVKPKNRHRFDERGNFSYPDNKYAEFKDVKITRKRIQITNYLVEEIRAICKQNETELIIYIAPYRDFGIDIAANDNIINHSGFISNKRLFYDDIHVNSDGRKYATLGFIKKFQELNLVKKRRSTFSALETFKTAE